MKEEITFVCFSPLDLFFFFLSFGLSSGQEPLPFPATFTGLENLDLRDSTISLFCCWFLKPCISSSQVQPQAQE